MTNENGVAIVQLPESVNRAHAHEFSREVDEALKVDRPHIVFDFSAVRHLDSTGVQMLLSCMEEAMKRGGDLKFAAIPPGPAVILELTRVDRLFEIFENAADAAESFHRFPPHTTKRIQPSWYSGAALEGEAATDSER
jgi:anti-sigma B factor antagonist